MAYANLCQQLYENITMSRDDVSAEAMQYYVEYQWFTMIKKFDAHMAGSQDVTSSIPVSNTIKLIPCLWIYSINIKFLSWSNGLLVVFDNYTERKAGNKGGVFQIYYYIKFF